MTVISELKTCNNCKHAAINNDIQVGCNINIADRLGFDQTESAYYDLKNICLFKNKEKEDVDISMGYIFVSQQNTTFEDIKQCIDKVLNNNPMWIGVYCYSVDIKDACTSYLNSLQIKYNILLAFSDTSDFDKLDKFIKNYLNGWTHVHVVGQEFKESSKELLFQKILIENYKIGLILENKDSINNMCYFNMIYKFLKGSKLIQDENSGEIIDKTFYEKLKEKSENMIYTWSDLT